MTEQWPAVPVGWPSMPGARMLEHLYAYTLPAAYSLLPPAMASPEASALLLAIVLQESGALHRRQVNGPARSFAQFEATGLLGVVTHHASRTHFAEALRILRYPVDLAPSPTGLLRVVEHNDTIALVAGRLLLWTLPDALPGPDEPTEAWGQYLDAWRPGKPFPDTWAAHYRRAWGLVTR